MKKLIQGILDFRQHRITEYRQKFSQLALGQSPDTLFIACSDSRVVPNLFASTDPGDLFVIRNVGNIVPPCDTAGRATEDLSQWAAIEFSILQLHISAIIVCGHSECGAIQAVRQGRHTVAGEHLQAWLAHAESTNATLPQIIFDPDLAEHNQLSQRNVLRQLAHLQTYPLIQTELHAGRMTLHGWWFDIATGNVSAFNPATRRFAVIGE